MTEHLSWVRRQRTAWMDETQSSSHAGPVSSATRNFLCAPPLEAFITVGFMNVCGCEERHINVIEVPTSRAYQVC